MALWLPILVPAAIAATCQWVSWRPWRRRILQPNGHWGGALGIAAAYFAAHVILLSWPAIPPNQSADRLAWMAVPLGLAGATQRWWGARGFTAWPLRILISAGMGYALLQARVENDWRPAEAYAWLCGVSLALAAQWFSLETLAARRTGASLPLGLWAYCIAAAAVFTTAGSASIGQFAAALAAAWGAIVVLAWWAPGLSVRGGAMTAFAPLYTGLLLRSYFFGELTPAGAALLFAAPFALWYGEQRRFRFARPWKAALVRAGLITAPALLALGIEWWVKLREVETL